MADDDGTKPPDDDPKAKLVWLNERRAAKQRERREREAEAPSDDTLALRFAEQIEHILRYTEEAGRWFYWTGTRWQPEATLLVLDLARGLCRETAIDFEMRKLADVRTISAVVRLVRSDRRIVTTMDLWDRDPWLLNTPAGAVDLRSGKLRPHRRDDYCTKITAVAPGGDCPLWRATLKRIFVGDDELISFIQRLFGYALTGDTSEEKFFFFWGMGGNGKSLILNTAANILGDYAIAAPSETFIASHSDRHPTELAMLKDRRLVTASEIDEGREWNEARIKQMTGRDRISARFMRQDFFEYMPLFKLIICGNHKPSLRRVSPAWRRRLVLVPFTLNIPPEEQDHDLPTKLRAEWPAILGWLIAGAIDWQERGLRPPTAVASATTEYLDAQDALTQWLEDCTRADPDAWCGTRALFTSWSAWCKEAGERGGTEKSFVQTLKEAGYRSSRDTRKLFRGFQGLALRGLLDD